LFVFFFFLIFHGYIVPVCECNVWKLLRTLQNVYWDFFASGWQCWTWCPEGIIDKV